MNSSKVKCTCGHSWDKSDSSKKDLYICHECGRNNSNNMKNGGWLDSYADGGSMQEYQENYNNSSVSLPKGFVGMGNNIKGRNYSPAWGGQFQNGGITLNAQMLPNNGSAPPPEISNAGQELIDIGVRASGKKLPFGLGSAIGATQSLTKGKMPTISDTVGLLPIPEAQLMSLVLLYGEKEKEMMHEFNVKKNRGKKLSELSPKKETRETSVDEINVKKPNIPNVVTTSKKKVEKQPTPVVVNKKQPAPVVKKVNPKLKPLDLPEPAGPVTFPLQLPKAQTGMGNIFGNMMGGRNTSQYEMYGDGQAGGLNTFNPHYTRPAKSQPLVPGEAIASRPYSNYRPVTDTPYSRYPQAISIRDRQFLGEMPMRGETQMPMPGPSWIDTPRYRDEYDVETRHIDWPSESRFSTNPLDLPNPAGPKTFTQSPSAELPRLRQSETKDGIQSWNIQQKNTRMRGRGGSYDDMNVNTTDPEQVKRALQKAEQYNNYIQKQYGNSKNPKAIDRLNTLRNDVEITPQYDEGGKVDLKSLPPLSSIRKKPIKIKKETRDVATESTATKPVVNERLVVNELKKVNANQKKIEDAKAYYANYLKSPKAKERITNMMDGYTASEYDRLFPEENDKKVNDEIKNRLEGLNKLQGKFEYINDFGIDQSSYYRPGTNKLFIRPKSDVNISLYNDPESIQYPNDIDNTIAHEMGHAVASASNRDSKNAWYSNTISKKESDLIMNNNFDLRGIKNRDEILKSKYNPEYEYDLDHDNRPTELKADIDALRYQLYKEGVYDAGTQDFTRDHLEKAKPSFTKSRLLEHFTEDALIDLMNKLSYNENANDTMPTAQMGGSIPGAVGFTYARTKGIPSNGPYAKKTLASAQNGTEMSYYQHGLDWKPKGMNQGGVIKDDRGQWAHPGKVTEINSNNITMKGVPFTVIGISDEGDVKVMKPGKDYKFKGKKVTEYPMAKNGVNQQDEKTLQHLDQLTNFTNYNKPQPGGWLNKYN